jgi:purine nucleoside phosphorylase
MTEAKIGIIGGSGLYKLGDALKDVAEVEITTPLVRPQML